MNPDEFKHFCNAGRQQREITWPQPMLPILVLFTSEGVQIVGVVGDADNWPAGFEKLRQEQHPAAAVLTADMHLRTYSVDEQPSEVRPRDDPEARNAIVVLASDGQAEVTPYSVADDGSFTWDEPEPAGVLGPVRAALTAMCKP